MIILIDIKRNEEQKDNKNTLTKKERNGDNKQKREIDNNMRVKYKLNIFFSLYLLLLLI